MGKTDRHESKLVGASQPNKRRVDFCDAAEKRYAEIVATGRAIAWSAMRRYLEDRLAGKKTPQPKARTLARRVQ